MNLEQVAHFIEHPQELTLSEAPALHALSEKYPFASLFSLLYLKALANGKSVDLDSALQQHAYRLNDRRQLFQLVQNGGVTGRENPEVDLHFDRSLRDERDGPEVDLHFARSLQDGNEGVERPVVADVVHAAVNELPIIESVAEPTVVTPDEVEIEEPAPTHDAIVNETESAKETAAIPENEDVISFEQMTDAFTLEQTYLQEAEREAEEEIGREIAEDQVEPAPVTAEQQIQTDEPKEVSAPAIRPEEKRSFTDWLKSASLPIDGLDEPATAVTTEPVPPAKPKVEEIIDTFIREEPSISRSKTEFFSPSKKARESLDEDALPVSETLAKIYAAQGNYPKAIHVYHQLMLSVPEKRSLFAVQIEALKKKISP